MSRNAAVGIAVVTALAVGAGTVASFIYNSFLEKKRKEDMHVNASDIIVRYIIF